MKSYNRNPEDTAIRSQLALRFNPFADCWEVYTTFHGSGIFRWFQISKEKCEWYMRTFPEIRIINHLEPKDSPLFQSTQPILGA